ncbi:MAG: hypothetical protein FJ100_09230 [Deltaproteobacteria bacterium]|nr:hypothetical protein [Deltaproteobacteria bacterium]
MNAQPLAVLTLVLLAAGAALSRFSPRRETRAVAIAHSGMALCTALASALSIGPSGALEGEALAGLVATSSLAVTMLPALAALSFALVLSWPEAESGHRTVAQSLGLPALAMAALLAGHLAVIVVCDIVLAVLTVHATEDRARKAQAVVRGGGVALILAGLIAVPTDLWFAPLPQAAPAMGLLASALMVMGVALQLGIGPASFGLRAAMCSGITARGVLTVLPLGGLALLMRVAGPAFAAAADGPTRHAVMAVALLGALVTAALVLVQRAAGAALALLLATSHALVLVGLVGRGSGAHLGGELLWAATLVAGAGAGVCLLALRARHGRLRLDRWNGFYASSTGLSALLLFFRWPWAVCRARSISRRWTWCCTAACRTIPTPWSCAH